MNLDNNFELKAERLLTLRCVEVKWNQVQSGECYVKYTVTLKDASGNNLYSKARYNNRQMKVCNAPMYNTATFAELKVSFKNTSKNFTASISGT